MPKRTSAFSKALQEAQQGVTVEPDTSIPAQKQTTGEVQKQMSVAPVEQQTSREVTELATSREVQKDTSEPVEKQAGKLIKASYYISESDDWKLEQIRIQRRRRGVKIDKSALIREAIGLLQE